MLRVAVGFLFLCILVSAFNFARAESALFSETITLTDGRLLVVEEQTREPRSVGSYSVRLYAARNPEHPYDDFQAGLVLARDGILESAREVKPENGVQRVIVTIRSVGTGSYATHHMLLIHDNSIESTEYRSGLMPGLDYSESGTH